MAHKALSVGPNMPWPCRLATDLEMENSITEVKNELVRRGGGEESTKINLILTSFISVIKFSNFRNPAPLPFRLLHEKRGALRDSGLSKAVEPRYPDFQSADIYLVSVESFLVFDVRFVQQQTQYLPEVN